MKKTALLLTAIIIGSFVLRLYKIGNPIADWHSWRQADTSAVTRNFIKQGFDPLHPRYDDISNIQTGKDNPQGYRFVEFPLYNIISYTSMVVTGNMFPLEPVERMVSIIASLISLFLIYKITSFFTTKTAGLFAGLFFGILPYSIYYSRVILPEPLMVCLALGSVYCFVVWQGKRNVGLLGLSCVLGGLAILTKPFAIFFFPPLLYFLFEKKRIKTDTLIPSIAFGIATVVPFFLWRSWISQYPEGIPAYDWLFNKNNIRFKGAFFYWLFAERLSKLILGYFGIFFLLLGVLSAKKDMVFFHLFGLSMLSYLVIVAGGNVQHDYYQVLLVPIICMYMGLSLDFILTHANALWNRTAAYGVIAVVSLFTVMFSWYEVRTYYWINNPVIVEAGKKADEILPKDALVIAPLGGDTAFLYQTNRKGWPQGLEIEKKMELGAEYYVTVTPGDPEVLYLKASHPVVFETDKYAILKLQ